MQPAKFLHFFGDDLYGSRIFLIGENQVVFETDYSEKLESVLLSSCDVTRIEFVLRIESQQRAKWICSASHFTTSAGCAGNWFMNEKSSFRLQSKALVKSLLCALTF